MTQRAAVMGTGSWGTTFAMVLADAGVDVRMWGRREEVCKEISSDHRNADYLGDVELPASVTASTDAGEVLDGADIVVLAVPSQSLRENLGAWSYDIAGGALLVSLMKGVELGSHQRMSEVVADVTGAGSDRIAVVSGPNLAKEIAARQPTATVVACSDHERAEQLARACSTGYFRPYTNTDVVGVEVGGAVKNVMALAVGIAEGMGFGDNSKATVITRGLAETSRLGAALGADPATIAGLAGLGDLVATCVSPLSRNRTFGVNLGQGMTVDEVVAATKQTAEGVKSCKSIADLAESVGVDMPIVDHVVAVVHDGMPVKEMAGSLLSRARKHEQA
ncbi:MAG TPA: NAD(P)H-dependent glycerol-3-phosphate dehydrogenase [Actinomycetales bacterium]|nr:NAD(P)H-dependent glycerol-3-phosphate dehydrogenase [Actinomycetales bacterium]